MQAYEFNSKIDNGMIHIPQQYRDKMPSDVKVIVSAHDERPKTVNTKFSAIPYRPRASSSAGGK